MGFKRFDPFFRHMRFRRGASALIAVVIALAMAIVPSSAQALANGPEMVAARMSSYFSQFPVEETVERVVKTGNKSVISKGFSAAFKGSPGLKGNGLALAGGGVALGLGITFYWLQSEMNPERELLPPQGSLKILSIVQNEPATAVKIQVDMQCNGNAYVYYYYTTGNSTTQSRGYATKFGGTGNSGGHIAQKGINTWGHELSPGGNSRITGIRFECGQGQSVILGTFSTATAQMTGVALPRDIPRQMEVRGECVDESGTVSNSVVQRSQVYTHQQNLSTGVEVPSVLCPEFTTPGSVEVTEIAPGGEVPERTIYRTPKVSEAPAIADKSDPCSAAHGYPCETGIFKAPVETPTTWGQCGSQFNCTPEAEELRLGTGTQTVTDPQGNTYKCQRGGKVISWAACEGLVESPTTRAPVEVEDTSNPIREAPKPIGTQTPTRTSPLPLPPNSVWECAPRGWELLNPVSYIYGTACVLAWAWIPPNLNSLFDLWESFIARPPGSLIVGGVKGIGNTINAFNAGCGAPLEFGPIKWTCSNPLGTTGVYLKAIVGGGVVMATAFQTWRLANSALGGKKE